jgi:murein peptide amidase A
VRGRIALGLALAAIAAGVSGQGAGADPKVGAAADQVVIGRSVQKRTITALQIGDRAGTRVALIVGVIHGDERAGLRIIRALEREARSQAGALAGTQLWVVPTVNPDGVRARTRKNSHGVDLNRNFPYRWRGDVPQSSGYYPGPRPASEPETRAVMALVRRIRPDLSIWYHQPWGAVLACHGRPQIAVEYAKLVGMGTTCRGEGLRGTATSWETRTIGGGTAFVVEMQSGRISGGSAKRQARAALTVAEGR